MSHTFYGLQRHKGFRKKPRAIYQLVRALDKRVSPFHQILHRKLFTILLGLGDLESDIQSKKKESNKGRNMDPATAFLAINWLAVLAASISAFIIGGLWYGPVFGKAWMTVTGINEEMMAARNQAIIFGGAFLLNVIMVVNLAMFIGPEADIVYGTAAGFFTGAFWVTPMLGVFFLFEGRPRKLFLINGGYATVALTTMGAILGAL